MSYYPIPAGMGNALAHFELMVKDPARAREFYATIFDWDLQTMDMDGTEYTMIDTGEEAGGGLMMAPEGQSPGMMVYIRVTSISSTLERWVELGGTIIKGETLISPEFGSFAMVADPDGVVLGIWKGARKD